MTIKRKMNYYIRNLILLIAINIFSISLYSQAMMIDRVVGIVGDFTILQSDIETQYLQYRGQGINMPDFKCMIFRDMIHQKLFLNQSKIDSIEISESNVELELNRRMQYFINQVGSQEELEDYFGKPVIQIKEDFREDIRNMLITQTMQRNITENIKITPSEVRRFFNSMPKDSIPFIDAQVEIQQILRYPPMNEDAIFEVKERLLDLRKRILDGDSFETLAILYSEDPGSAVEGGEIGYMARGELDPEYAKAAFSLKIGGISKIVESEFGFHIIQLIKRRDETVNTRHILMKPKISPESRKAAIDKLDSILIEIRRDSINFEKAALYFSEDKNSAVNQGLLVNPETNSTQFELTNLDPKDYLIARDLKIGEISDPYESLDENKKVIYKIIKLKSRTDPHKANLDQDYMLIQNMALAQKNEKVIQDWLSEKEKETYIHIDKSFSDCSIDINGE